jgi:hypothetical protein
MREHWLETAHGRIVAGDDELEVLADYGWVQLTAEEREAIKWAVSAARNVDHPDEDTLRKLLERTGDELSALAPADRQNITQESQNSDTLPAYGVWRDRSEQPPMDKPVLLFTNHLDGFMWIGRRGLLPNDVSHWTPLPEPPNVNRSPL